MVNVHTDVPRILELACHSNTASKPKKDINIHNDNNKNEDNNNNNKDGPVTECGSTRIRLQHTK